jgi:TonB family protein
MHRLLKYSTILIALTALVSAPARSQQSPAPPAQSFADSTYPDTPEGLQQFFANFLAAAKTADRDKLSAMVTNTRIPDFAAWFVDTYGAEPGKSWTDSYRANLEKNEAAFADLSAQLAHKPGAVIAQAIHDTPEQPVDTYLLTWKSDAAPGTSQTVPIAYFIFAAGTFRLDNVLVFRNLQTKAGLLPLGADAPNQIPPQTPNPKNYSAAPVSVTGNPDGPFVPGVGGVGFPTCIYCPQPYFSDEARTGKLQGTELLNLTVQPDGHVTNLTILKSLGEDPDEVAIATVHGWRLEPAFGPDARPVAVTSQIQITFQLTPSK